MSTRHLPPTSGGRTFYPNSSNSANYRSASGSDRNSSVRNYPPTGARPQHFSRDGPPPRGMAGPLGDLEFSSYYRDRFGSHSPEEYKNLRLSHINPKIQNSDLRDILEKEFRRYGEMQVKIVPQGNSISDRLAYINFDRPDLARRARKNCLPKLSEILGRYLKVDPAGVIRDQDGRYVQDRASQLPPYPGGFPPPPGSGSRRTPSPPPPRAEFFESRRPTSRGGEHPTSRGGEHPTSRGGEHRFSSGGRDIDFFGGSGRQAAGGRHHPPQYHRSASGHNRPRERSSVSPPRRTIAERNGGGHPPVRPRSRSSTGPAHQVRVTSNSVSRSQQQSDLEYWKLKEDLEQGATRTLFVGNLPGNIRESELRRTFEKYGRVEDVDIKHPHEPSGAAYAFVMYQNMDQSQLAKYNLSDQLVAGQKCKIGYGKPTKSPRLWVGGLGPWTSLESLEKEFDRYGAIEKIEYSRGGNHAYVSFASIDAASEACQAMKGFPLGGRDRCIRVDFASMVQRSESSSEEEVVSSKPKKERRKRSRSKEPLTVPPPSKAHKRGPHTPPNSPPPSPKEALKTEAAAAPAPQNSTSEKPAAGQQHLSATNLTEIEQIRSACWTGALVLKKSAYPIRLYNLRGDDDLIDGLLRDSSQESVKLHVTQRLPFQQASPTDFQRYLEMTPTQAAFLLAGPNPNATAADLRLANSPTRPLKAFVHYLSEKSAAGVVSLTPGDGASATPVGLNSTGNVLYAFPRCELADNLLKELCPNLAVMRNCADDCLLAVLVRGAGKGTEGK